MNPPSSDPLDLAPLTTALADVGLNTFGVADPVKWDAVAGPTRLSAELLPGTQAILVFGSGGGRLWDSLLADLTANPRHLGDEEHPLDAFVRRQVAFADAALGPVHRRWFFASANADVHLDFRLLADLAGLGGRSRLGLLLNPDYGVWLGLRAACFIAAPVPFSAPAVADPCVGCPAPCLDACPGEAFLAGHWNVDRCSAFHAVSTRCASSCDARRACPVAPHARYGDDEFLYHYDRAQGRIRLRQLVGLPEAEDAYEGVGPHWQTWRRKVDVRRATEP